MILAVPTTTVYPPPRPDPYETDSLGHASPSSAPGSPTTSLTGVTADEKRQSSLWDSTHDSPLRDLKEDGFLVVPTMKRPGSMDRRGSFMEKASNVSKGFGRAVRISKKHDKNRPVHTACIEFCESTTAHGWPMLLTTSRGLVQFLWIVVSIISIFVFIWESHQVWEKYQRNDKIVNVELEFESAPFPAITVCNLNPFKKHLARSVPEISETLDAFHQAVVFSNDAQVEGRERGKRDVMQKFRNAQYEPVISACDCKRGTDKECIGTDAVPDTLESACVCNYDRQDGSSWPCYSSSTWEESICPECNDIGFCNLPNTTGVDMLPCMCQTMGYCILKADHRLKRIWEFRGKKIPDKNSPLRKDFMEHLEKLGYANMTDQVAITTQAKEKLILKMSALHPLKRASLGYGKSELIKMCSFNGHQCDIEKEFKLHIDSSFGNCYTFNADHRKNKTSSRAGPSYGLRLMLFVNSSDYLPTTEATGVRIAIHGQQECPFPDTFGYSAPTGVISSFGISLRRVNRLPKPYGDCFEADKHVPQGYIYKKYKYEPEGCYRSCYQNRMIKKCGCADPRFPVQHENDKLCDVRNETIQECLLTEGGKLSARRNPCRCTHPCKQDVYSTTYSAAKWPSGSIKMECDGKAEDCNKYFSEHAAMLEIYYEQMAYEVLKEAESYLFVNMMSDIGGQAGLWIGASFITLLEFFSFILRITWINATKCFRKSDKLLDEKDPEEFHEKDNQKNQSQEEYYR